MKYHNVFFIYNPSSGNGKITKFLPAIKRVITENAENFSIVQSESREHFTSNIISACTNCDLVIVAGGDGTVNLLANAIKGLNTSLPTFAYLPTGTTCDMAYNLGMSKNPTKAIRQIFSGKPTVYDIGSIGDERFVYVANLGAVSGAVCDTPPKLKKRYGKVAYALHILSNTKKSFAVSDVMVNSANYTTPLLLVSNSKEIASFKINKSFNNGFGKYYVIVVKNSFLHGIDNIVYLFLHGVKQSIKRNKIVYIEGTDFMIENRDSIWSVDGELSKAPPLVRVGFSGQSINIITH